MSQAVPVLNYSSFYSTRLIPESPLESVMCYELEDVILTFVAIRNSLHYNGYDYAKDEMIAAFLSRLPLEKSTLLSTFLFGEEKFAFVHTVVISKILVDLFKRLQFNSPTKDLNAPEFEENVLDVILVYNENHYNRFILDPLPDTHELVWSLLLMQKLTGVSEVDYARTGPIKHLIFLRFLRISLGDKYIEFEQSLKEMANLDTPHQFLTIFLNIYLFITGKNTPKNVLPQFSSDDPDAGYLRSIGMVIDEEMARQGKFDIGTLITHPFFLSKNGNTYLLDHQDFSLLMEQVWVHLLYHKSSIKSLLPHVRNFNGFQGFIGLQYYERYLMGTLLVALERSGIRVIRSDDRNLSDFTMIVNETDVFIIEVKAVSIHYKIFEQQDGTGFKKFVDDNFSDGKGIAQLERNIRYLADDKLNLLSLRKPAGKLTIFPIIVFVDPQLNIHAVNDYLTEKSKSQFMALVPHFKEIQPLTLMSSDFFVENIELLQKDRSLLKRLIMGYHTTIKNNKRNYLKFQSTEKYMRSMISFDHYVIGKENIYRLPQAKIFQYLTRVFKLKENM